MREKRPRVPDFYEVLGVTKEATLADIKAAYMRIIRENHPDRNADDKEKLEFTKLANQAYEILGDIDRRKVYDLKLETTRPFKISRPNVYVPPLFLSVVNGDSNAVELELRKCSSYFYVYQRFMVTHESVEMSCCALDIAIIKGSLPIVELILRLNFDISCDSRPEDNVFVIAAKYYKKEIFDLLIKTFCDQKARGGVNPAPFRGISGLVARTHPELTYLKTALSSIIREFERVDFAVFRALLAQGIDPFDRDLLDALFCRPACSLLASAYIKQYGPGRCMTACIQNRRSEYLDRLATMGYQIRTVDERGYTAYQALTDASLEGRWQDPAKTWTILSKILRVQLPSYSDFLNATEKNYQALYILLVWEFRSVPSLLEEAQHIDLFIAMLRNHTFNHVDLKKIFFLYDNKYKNFCQKVDEDNNNFLHVLTTVEDKISPVVFLEFFEEQLQKKYPDEVNNILAKLLSGRNKQQKTPYELDIKSPAIKSRYKTLLECSSQPRSTTQEQSEIHAVARLRTK